MAYNANIPGDNDTIAAFPAAMRENERAIIQDQIVNAGLLNGLKSGNASGNIPVNNGNLNIGLNAEKLQGKQAADFAPAGWVPPVATSSSNGSLANTDKAKLDTIATGAEVNQPTFSNIIVGGTKIQADNKTDTFELVGGANIALAADAVNDKVTINLSGKVPSASSADVATNATNAVNATNAANVTTGCPSTDLKLGYGGTGRGNGGRALVQTDNNALVINYANDFSTVAVQSGLSATDMTARGKQVATVDQIPTSLPANGGTSQVANQLKLGSTSSTFNWSGQGGQPTWLWGGNDPNNMYVYNPSNFNVNYANSAGKLNGYTFDDIVNKSTYGNRIYFASQTFVVPTGVTKLLVTGNASGGLSGDNLQVAVGGASSGGWKTNYGGIGGYGARVYKRQINVTPGESIPITIGGVGNPSGVGRYLTLSAGGRGGNATSSGNGAVGANASPQEQYDGQSQAHFYIEWGC